MTEEWKTNSWKENGGSLVHNNTPLQHKANKDKVKISNKFKYIVSHPDFAALYIEGRSIKAQWRLFAWFHNDPKRYFAIHTSNGNELESFQIQVLSEGWLIEQKFN